VSELLDLEGLKKRPDLIRAIDWDMTPRQAFEIFQLKGAEGWRHRGLSEVVYFYLSTWQGERRLLLVRRSHVASEELAEIAAPAELLETCAREGEGEDMPRGQTAVSGELREWLRERLGKG
jgi:hypothetical protein